MERIGTYRHISAHIGTIVPGLLGNMLCICARTSRCCRSKVSRSSFKRSSSQCNSSGPSMATRKLKLMCNPAFKNNATRPSFSSVRVMLDCECSWYESGTFWKLISLNFLVFAVELGPDIWPDSVPIFSFRDWLFCHLIHTQLLQETQGTSSWPVESIMTKWSTRRIKCSDVQVRATWIICT